MAGPERGQPFTLATGLRFSIGDMFAAPGTVAYEGVVVGAPPLDVPPGNHVPPGTPVRLTVYMKDADALGGAWMNAAINSATINFHITNVENNTLVGTFPSGPVEGPLTAAQEPQGASAPLPGEVVQWFRSTSPDINLPAGATYKILTHIHGNGPFATTFGAFHDSTYVNVLP